MAFSTDELLGDYGVKPASKGKLTTADVLGDYGVTPPEPEPEPPGLIERAVDAGGRALSKVGEFVQPAVDFGERLVEGHVARNVETGEAVQDAAQQIAAAEGGDIKSGFQMSVGSAEHLAANASMIAREFFETGSQDWPRQDMAALSEFFEEKWRERSQRMMRLAEENASDTKTGKALQVAGGLPLGLATAGAFAAGGGPILGFGMMGGLGAADQGKEAALKETVKGMVLGTVMRGTHGAARVPRAASVGGTAAVQSEGEGIDKYYDTAVMATLAGAPNARPSTPWLPPEQWKVPRRYPEDSPQLPDRVKWREPKGEELPKEMIPADEHPDVRPVEPPQRTPEPAPAPKPAPKVPEVQTSPAPPGEGKLAPKEEFMGEPAKILQSELGTDGIRTELYEVPSGGAVRWLDEETGQTLRMRRWGSMEEAEAGLKTHRPDLPLRAPTEPGAKPETRTQPKPAPEPVAKLTPEEKEAFPGQKDPVPDAEGWQTASPSMKYRVPDGTRLKVTIDGKVREGVKEGDNPEKRVIGVKLSDGTRIMVNDSQVTRIAPPLPKAAPKATPPVVEKAPETAEIEPIATTRGERAPKATPPGMHPKEIAERVQGRIDENLKAAGRDRTIRMVKEDEPGRFYIIHRSTRKPGEWQETHFRDGEPTGHVEHKTRDDAIRQLSKEGWKVEPYGERATQKAPREPSPLKPKPRVSKPPLPRDGTKVRPRMPEWEEPPPPHPSTEYETPKFEPSKREKMHIRALKKLSDGFNKKMEAEEQKPEGRWDSDKVRHNQERRDALDVMAELAEAGQLPKPLRGLKGARLFEAVFNEARLQGKGRLPDSPRILESAEKAGIGSRRGWQDAVHYMKQIRENRLKVVEAEPAAPEVAPPPEPAPAPKPKKTVPPTPEPTPKEPVTAKPEKTPEPAGIPREPLTDPETVAKDLKGAKLSKSEDIIVGAVKSDTYNRHAHGQLWEKVSGDFLGMVLDSPKAFKGSALNGARAEARRRTGNPVPEGKPKNPPKKLEDPVEALGLAASRDETRYNLNWVYVDGKRAVATDGHRLHSFEGTDHGLKPGWYERGNSGKWRREPVTDFKDRPGDVPGEFPNVDQVIPGRADKTYELDARQATALASDLQASISRTGLGKENHPINIPGGGKEGLSLPYFLDALNAARAAGDGSVRIGRQKKAIDPWKIEATGKNGDFLAVVMPVRNVEIPQHIVDWSRYIPGEEPSGVSWRAMKPEPAETPAEKVTKAKKTLESRAPEVQEKVANPEEPGDNYQPFLSQKYDPQAVAEGRGGKVFRRDEILKRFVKNMKQTIYQGRMGQRSKEVLGFFKNPTGEMRIRNRNDLEVTAHEMGHLVEQRYPEVVKMFRANPVIKAEMKEFGYQKGAHREGWADFNRVWLTQPKNLAMAPRTAAYFEKLLQRHPELGHAYRTAQKEMLEWFGMDSLRQAESKLGPTFNLDDMFQSRYDEYRQGWIDKTRGSERFERYMNEGELLDAADSPTKNMRVMAAARDIVSGMLKWGPIRAEGREILYEGEGRGLIPRVYEHATSKGGNLKDFFMYMVGVRAGELFKEGRENLFKPHQIEAMRKLETPEYKEAAARYQEFNEGLLDYAVDKGILSPEMRDVFLERFYVPFLRETASKLGRSQTPGGTSFTHRLTGGTENLRDIGENILHNMLKTVELGMENEVIGQWVKLSKGEGGQRFLTKVGKDSEKVGILREDAKKGFEERFIEAEAERKAEEFREQGLEESEVQDAVSEWLQSEGPALRENIDAMWDGLGPVLTMWHRGLAPRGDGIIVHLENGKPTYYEVGDPLLLRTAQAFHMPGADNKFIKFLHSTKRMKTWTITRALRFATGNIVKDQAMAGTMARYGYRPFIDGAHGLRIRTADYDRYRAAMRAGAKGLKAVGAKGLGRRMDDMIDRDLDTYLRWKAAGGGMAGIMDAEAVTSLSQSVRTSMKSLGKTRAIIDTGLKMKNFMDVAFESSETATRLGLMRRAEMKGVGQREAAYESRDIIDYARRGDLQAINYAVDTVPFLRAAMNGMDRFVQGAWREKGGEKLMSGRAKVWAGLAAASGLSALNAAVNYRNPIYEKEDQSVRDMYVIVNVPTVETIEAMARGDWDLAEERRIMEEGTREESEAAWQRVQDAYHTGFIPKPFEVGSIMSAAEIGMYEILKAADGEETDAGAKIADAILRNFNVGTLPAAVHPLWETLRNKTTFTGRKVTPQHLLEPYPVDAAERWTPDTPRVLRDAGKITGKIGVSPIEMEHWIDSLFNAWGTAGLGMLDRALYEDAPTPDPTDTGLLSRFRRNPAKGSRVRTELYQLTDEVMRAKTTADLILKREPERYKAYVESHPEAMLADALQGIVDGDRNQSNIRRVVKEAKGLEAVQKLTRMWLDNIDPKGQRLRDLKKTGTWKHTGMLKTFLDNTIRTTQRLDAMRSLKKLEPKTKEIMQ